MRKVTISGRRYFDKYYGNTYNTVRILVTTDKGHGFCRDLPVAYGYGSMFEQRALEWLRDNFPAWRNNHNGSTGYEFALKNDWLYHVSTKDVSREKDL